MPTISVLDTTRGNVSVYTNHKICIVGAITTDVSG